MGRPLNDVETKNAPERLYVAGGMKIPIQGSRVAIVGTRKASPGGLGTANRISRELVKKDVVIVSGLAEGIDTAAHTGAIDSGGRTLAVLGTPLDKFYPSKNRDLQQRIMVQHLAVSQFPIGQPIQRSNFIIRNKTMALLCDASIIIEAGNTSGTLSQGWEALRLGRPLFIWKDVFNNGSLSWPDEMLDYGAAVLTNLDQVLEVLPNPSRILKVVP